MDSRNVLYVHTHDTGRCFSVYGYPIVTPNVDRLAEHCTVFTRAYSAAPTCSPSRSALLSGLYPHELGMTGLAHRGFSWSDYGTHLAPTLGRGGWETVLFGVQHEARDSAEIGYGKIIDQGNDAANSEAAANFLRSADPAGTASPFFLSYGMFLTHRPFEAGSASPAADFVSNFLERHTSIPATGEVEADLNDYAASIATVDKNLGILLDAMDHAGLWDNTVVVFTTDHGPPFPGMKATLSDEGTGVTLLMALPGIDQVERCDSLVSHLDVYPTILESVGLGVGKSSNGRSLEPDLQGGGPQARTLFCETSYHAAYEPARGLRTDQHRLIKRFGPTHRVPANVDDSPAKALLAERGYFETPMPEVLIHDPVADPEARHNLADDPQHRGLRDDLLERLRLWMIETKDPLLRGGLSAPAGSIVDSAEQWSPS